MKTNPLDVMLWLAALRAVRGFTVGTWLREVERHPSVYQPRARA